MRLKYDQNGGNPEHRNPRKIPYSFFKRSDVA